MTSLYQKGNVLVWLVLSITLIGIAGAGYLVFQSNNDSKEPVSNQENAEQATIERLQQPEEKSKEVSEDTAKGTVITTTDSEFGSILVDSRGQAIYIWEVEESTTAECYGDCAEAWPPVLTDGKPSALGSVDTELLGTTSRSDGTTQVTYNGHLLYYYAHEAPGEVKCHNISTHGGLWWVIQPSGVRAK